MGVLGGVFVLKSGLRILIRDPKCHFRYPPKRRKWVILGVFGYFGGTKNGTSGALIKILRPLFNTNTPLKPHLTTLGTILDPGKDIVGQCTMDLLSTRSCLKSNKLRPILNGQFCHAEIDIVIPKIAKNTQNDPS